MKQIYLSFAAIVILVMLIPFMVVFSFGGVKLQKNPDEKIIKVYFSKEDTTAEMKLEDFLVGVVSAEMPASFEIEALKAQAVTARSYVLNRVKNGDKEAHKGGDICDDSTHCNAYKKRDEAILQWGEKGEENLKKIQDAVIETRGLVIKYDNEVVSAVYHAASSGKTENSEDVWTASVPYLRSVDTTGEDASPTYKTVVSVGTIDFVAKLKEYKPETRVGLGTPKVGEIIRTTGGGVKTIQIGDTKFEGTKIRELFGLRSTNFTIEIGDETTEFTVLGNGHGVGMSQWGANYFAKQGKKYDEILKHYYTGITISKY